MEVIKGCGYANAFFLYPQKNDKNMSLRFKKIGHLTKIEKNM